MASKKSKNLNNTSKIVSLVFLASSVFSLFFVFTMQTASFNLDVFAKRPSGGGAGGFCSDQYSPVCGTNGVTYSNTCYANKAKATIACQGTCPCGTPRPTPEPVIVPVQ